MDRYGRKKKVTYRGTIKWVLYPSEAAIDEAYDMFIEASLRAMGMKRREEKTWALKSRIEDSMELTKKVVMDAAEHFLFDNSFLE